MKRHPGLRGLSSEHHNALTLAHSLERRVRSGGDLSDAARHLVQRFDHQLEPHILVEEEEELLPALRRAGELALVARTESEHQALRAYAAAARAGRTDELLSFAQLLTEHVRFEERELFPRCEATLDGSVDVESDLPSLDGDVVRLEQVVTNLLANAIKYTPRGGTIRAAVTRHDGELILRVRDSGVGIAAEQLEAIFDVFVQAPPRSIERAADWASD
jgi:signal transduction histidine kinase